MPRYKKITHYDVERVWEDWYIFHKHLIEKGFLIDEFECGRNLHYNIGDVIQVSHQGEKFIAIKSNYGRRWTHWKRSRKTCKQIVDHYTDVNILYCFTEEGWQYVKELITEQKIAE